MKTRLALASLLSLLALSAAASDALQEVVVTGSLVRDYDEMPAVTLTQPADFLVYSVRLVNDSRSPELRKTEIISTIEGMLKRTARQPDMALSYGDGFVVPVDLNDDALTIIEDKRRADTSGIDIFVKVALTRSSDTQARIAALKKFIDDTAMIGRTELEILGDVGLSIVEPEKYRDDILARIAQENIRIARTMGQGCRVRVRQLEQRVQWERTGVAELKLFIPHEVEVYDCTYAD